MRRLMRLPLAVATILALVAISVLPLLTPLTHLMLDLSGAGAGLHDSFGLRLIGPETHMISDATIHRLVWGGDFAGVHWPDNWPFYNDDETRHLENVRSLLRIVLALGGVSILAIGLSLGFKRSRLEAWHAIRWGAVTLAVLVMLVAVISFFYFDQTFTVFHEALFPEGNYIFDADTSAIVWLYPDRFWQYLGAWLGVCLLVASGATWWYSQLRIDETVA